MYRKGQFKLQDSDELRVDLRNPVYHTLLWIACADNLYKTYAILKASNTRYLKRIDWRLEERRYKDVKFMHRWYLTPNQNEKELTIKSKRFLTEECIRGQQ